MKLMQILTNQRGAMFGMDARIALIIFAAISTIGGGYALTSLSKMNGQATVREMEQLSIAIEGIHQDLKEDLHSTLTVSNDTNAFAALYNKAVLTATYQNKWLGPYTRLTSNTHPKYGAITITKKQDDHVSACLGDNCYIWLSYSLVQHSMTSHMNEILDGTSETTAKNEGRFQWTGDSGDVPVFFLVGHALN